MLLINITKIQNVLGFLSSRALPIYMVLMIASTANAEDVSPFEISGFGTLGLARSSSKDVEFIRDLSQPKGIKSGEWSGLIDTILGIQASWQLNAELEAVGQLVSRYHYDDNRDPRMDWAFVKWTPDSRLSLRFGRIGSDIMMGADSRMVGYSYLTVRPNVDFFGPLIFSSIDGADGSLTLQAGDGLVRTKLFAGTIQEKVSGSFGTWDTSGSHIYGAIIDYFIDQWLFRIGSGNARYSRDIETPQVEQFIAGLYAAADATGITDARNAADGLRMKNTNSQYYYLGAIYDKGPLKIHTAVNKIVTEADVFQDTQAAYLLASYRVQEITPYIGISRWSSSSKNLTTGLPDSLTTPYGIVDFNELNQGYQTFLDATGANQTTLSLGARWDVVPNIALKFQWDSIHGSEDTKTPYASSQVEPGWTGRTDVISTTLDFIF